MKLSFKPLAVLVSRTLTFDPEAGVGVRTSVGGIYYLRPLHDSIVEHREDHVETVGTETAYTNKDIITSRPKKESCTNEAHHTPNKVSRQIPNSDPDTKPDVKLITEIGKVTSGTESGLI